MLRRFTTALKKTSHAGLAMETDLFRVARVRQIGGGKLSLVAGDFPVQSYADDWAARTMLRNEGIDLAHASLTSVLPSGAYQMLLVEAPNVPDDEMREAVRWRIKDIIDYPVEEAVIELFEMPPHTNTGQHPMVHAVATRRENVLEQIDLMARANLQMKAIDIPELCIRNFAVHLPQDEDGVAFLHFVADCGYMTITRQRVLHLIRRIDTGTTALREAGADLVRSVERSSAISLEIQRSLDYYESHYDYRPITEIVLGPGGGIDSLAGTLKEQLGLKVSRADFATMFELEQELNADQQSDCLLAVGAALPVEVAA